MAAKVQKSESSNSSSGHVSDLPSFLIYEILVKLPIKSVIRCRCVCKNWNDLISEKHFATLYSKNPPFTVLVRFKHSMVEDRPVNHSSCFIEIGLDGDMTCTPSNPRAMNFHTSDQTVITNVTGSCNGLLCLVQTPLDQNRFYDYNNEAVYIINPLLGEVMMLPQVNQSYSMEFVFYGFGCSRHSGLYKVLRFVIRSCERIHGEILTIGVDHKWRSFEKSSVPYIRYIYSHGVNLNGVVYFIGDGDAVGFPFGFILAFDVEEERGHLIPLPSEFGDAPCLSVLTVCNDNFYLYDNSFENHLITWTLKRHGVVESWSKEIIMKSWTPLDLSFDRLNPITKLRNGDLLWSCQRSLFDNSKVLISYSPKTNECRTLEVSDGDEESSYFFSYVPSFFPLNSVLGKDTNV